MNPTAPPPEFLCPISLDLMRDPVLCDDGHTYERTVILQWLATNPTSPTTRQPMSPQTIRPNYALKAAIERWRKSQPAPPPKPIPNPRQNPYSKPNPSAPPMHPITKPFPIAKPIPSIPPPSYIAIPIAPPITPYTPLLTEAPPRPPQQPRQLTLRQRKINHCHPILLLCYACIIGVFVFMWHEGMFGG